MAIIHRAYTIDADAFHRRLAQQVIEDGHLRKDRLLQLAAEVAARASDQMRDNLERWWRFDPEWLDNSDPEISLTTEWYILVLAEALVPVPSLTNRLPTSYSVMELILPLVGWSAEDIRSLVHGQRLSTFVTTSGNPVFIHEFAGGADQHAGWLPPERIRELTERLAACERIFVDPTPETRTVLWRYAERGEEPATVLRLAYADAQDMLQAGIDSGGSLVLQLD